VVLGWGGEKVPTTIGVVQGGGLNAKTMQGPQLAKGTWTRSLHSLLSVLQSGKLWLAYFVLRKT
jgi:hypothetical protein